MVETEWVDVYGFSDYSVNRLGQICRNATGRILVQKQNQYGVVYVGMMRDNRQHQRSVALIVASTFIPRPPGPLDTPIHKNGDRWDNSVENLVWRPRWYAVKYNRQFRRPYEHSIHVAIRDIETGIEYRNSWEAAQVCGLLEEDIVQAILNSTWTAITYQRFEVA